MNPHAHHATSAVSCVQCFVKNWHIIIQMIHRDAIGKYKGSFLGVFWSFVTPILMLVVYTFVFSVVFKARWITEDNMAEDTQVQFAIFLFIGMLVHGLFAEAVNASTTLILGNVNFVKKVVFPLEILPIIKVGSSFFNFTVGLLVLLAAFVLLGRDVHLTIIFLPIIIFPLLLLILGVSWFLSALSVYVRDINHPVTIFTSVLMFLSPVFFPMKAIPEVYHALILANPLTFIIEQSRDVLI
ncbi:MAG TPA: ABC transporter permease, partial [Cellvibrio sp.]|nr:ABC transporter permease [Cellvibrio sp.]